MIKAVRGTRDLLPPDTALWNHVESVVRDVFRAYNFQEIRTPIFEATELFARGVGEETDIVSKEMFTWEDRGRAESDKGNSLTLRPENTAGVVRAYIEHKLWDRGLNKLYYIGPQFRRERPQKGRYRQFYQIGAEVIGPASSGSESPARDAEVLEMLATLLDRLGIKNWTLELNSVGSSAERAKFNDALRVALEPVKDKLCGDCQRRAVTNPLRVLDCKVPEDQPIIEALPRITQFLEDDSRRHFESVQEILKAVGVAFTINSRLVRGLDYYTRTAFEFTHGALGAQNAILGGGRYDGLSEALGGPAAPGIGFAIGEDRLVMSLQETSPAESVVKKPDVYIAPLGPGMNAEAARLARDLRRQDIVADLGDESFRLKKSFEAATKAGAKYILIVGENEVKEDAFALKNLASGEQITVPRAELAQKIKNLAMGKTRSTIDEAARAFIAAQKIFFVATAPLDPAGHVNLSPKGLDTFRILGPTEVAYLDFNGSGVETIAHLKENGRVVLMFCAFQGPPDIYRIYGRGRAVEPHHEEFSALAEHFPAQEHFRSIIVIEVDRVTDSCGYGVPLFQYEGERDQLKRWGKKQGAEGLKAYRERKNRQSIDGLPGLFEETRTDGDGN